MVPSLSPSERNRDCRYMSSSLCSIKILLKANEGMSYCVLRVVLYFLILVRSLSSAALLNKAISAIDLNNNGWSFSRLGRYTKFVTNIFFLFLDFRDNYFLFFFSHHLCVSSGQLHFKSCFSKTCWLLLILLVT